MEHFIHPHLRETMQKYMYCVKTWNGACTVSHAIWQCTCRKCTQLFKYFEMAMFSIILRISLTQQKRCFFCNRHRHHRHRHRHHHHRHHRHRHRRHHRHRHYRHHHHHRHRHYHHHHHHHRRRRRHYYHSFTPSVHMVSLLMFWSPPRSSPFTFDIQVKFITWYLTTA